jgi:hypothetical protein
MRDERLPGTRIMSPKVVMMFRGSAAQATALST